MSECCCNEEEQYICIPCKFKRRQMSDKDEKEFDKWFKEKYRYDYKDLVIPESVNPQKEAWKAACEYKQKEIDKVKKLDKK